MRDETGSATRVQERKRIKWQKDRKFPSGPPVSIAAWRVSGSRSMVRSVACRATPDLIAGGCLAGPITFGIDVLRGNECCQCRRYARVECRIERRIRRTAIG